MSKKIDDGMNAKQRYNANTKQINITVKLSQYENIAEHAQRHGKTVAQWMKDAMQFYLEWQNENA